ncbi:MAG: dienelactone hydrolase family protein [Terracidiphilus sp.]
MSSLKCIMLLALFTLTASQIPAVAAATDARIDFASLDSSHQLKVYGTLYLPESASGRSPAVVMIHGTMGIDSRGTLYRVPLLNAGIAVFEVNFKDGIYKSPIDRPKIDTFLPLAFAALKELRKVPSIDPARIGIMGFSLGGAITLSTALDENRKAWMGDEKGFAAHAGFYPVAKAFIPKIEGGSALTGAPIVIFYGTDDAYGDGDQVPELKSLLQTKFNFELTTYEYPGATHGFNLNAPPITYFDPAAKHMRGHMAYDAQATEDSLPKLVDFMRKNLAVK